jgi:hypothetical protein
MRKIRSCTDIVVVKVCIGFIWLKTNFIDGILFYEGWVITLPSTIFSTLYERLCSLGLVNARIKITDFVFVCGYLNCI